MTPARVLEWLIVFGFALMTMFGLLKLNDEFSKRVRDVPVHYFEQQAPYRTLGRA